MLDDYRGPFDPTFHTGQLSRRALAALAREYQMAAHLQDRAGIPQVLARHGAAAMREIAIAEWMGASPVYTQRIQRALGFSGDDVATIFKGMQFDVGAPHGFLDFRFRVDPDGRGEFWLPYCGALMDVEPMGESFVVGMCHDIEDPTFDATAVATNPRAQVRPIHRPPRQPADRMPHCHWRVAIEPDATPVEEIPLTAVVRRSRLAQLELPPIRANGDGRSDYAGALDPELELEDLSHDALRRVADEFCVQGHLLVRSFMLALAERWGDDAAREIATHQWVGIAGIAAERVVEAMGVGGDDLDAVARLFQLHPAFHPRAYIDLHVERTTDAVRCWVVDCPALTEGDAYGWLALPAPARHRALDAIARVASPWARTQPCEVPGAAIAWTVTIDRVAEPVPEPPEVAITRLSRGSTFRFASRRAAG
ncbi:MAG TPA: hypothetical protein VGR62_18640 [Candidatus Binatia bacterium]|nr:hypothetical protein [Candidatus Binatia bacterium]